MEEGGGCRPQEVQGRVEGRVQEVPEQEAHQGGEGGARQGQDRRDYCLSCCFFLFILCSVMTKARLGRLGMIWEGYLPRQDTSSVLSLSRPQ